MNIIDIETIVLSVMFVGLLIGLVARQPKKRYPMNFKTQLKFEWIFFLKDPYSWICIVFLTLYFIRAFIIYG